MADRIVVVAATAPMVQVEDFPEGCARSCKGALHLRPGGTKVVTEDELAHLKGKHPKVAAALRVVDTTPAKAKPAAKPVPVATGAVADTVVPGPSPVAPPKPGGRRSRGSTPTPSE